MQRHNKTYALIMHTTHNHEMEAPDKSENTISKRHESHYVHIIIQA
jgi:hypothetical protein